MIESQLSEFKETLRTQAGDYDLTLPAESIAQLAKYFSLLTSWNARLHLVAFDSPREFATRHILESLMLLRHLPVATRIVDIGSGGGLPIIPCLLARPDLQATLVEASKKKATFLREVVRQTNISPRSAVIAERFENITCPEADFVTCRALERFESMLPRLVEWSPTNASLLLFGGAGLGNAINDSGFAHEQVLMPHSERRYLFILNRPRSFCEQS